MSAHKLLREIEEFKKKLKEYRELTESVVGEWSSHTELNKKLETPEDDEKKYEEIKSELSQKLALFGEDLRENIKIITYSSKGEKIGEQNGIRHIFTLASTLKEERLIIYNFNTPEMKHHKKIWSIVLNGIERYIGGLIYFDDRKDDLKKRELELRRKEEELEKNKIHVDALSNALEKFMKIVTDPKKGPIEAIRSEYMSKIKENHRKIEERTNPNTKSQQKG